MMRNTLIRIENSAVDLSDGLGEEVVQHGCDRVFKNLARLLICRLVVIQLFRLSRTLGHNQPSAAILVVVVVIV